MANKKQAPGGDVGPVELTNDMPWFFDMPSGQWFTKPGPGTWPAPFTRPTPKPPPPATQRLPLAAPPPTKSLGLLHTVNYGGAEPVDIDRRITVQASNRPPGPYPPRFYNKPGYPRMASIGEQLQADAARGFAGAMQGAMGQMWNVNQANQAASLQHKGMLANLYGQRMAALGDLYGKVIPEQIRAGALLQALGFLAGGSGDGGDMGPRPGYTSNIGQGIQFYPWS